jgi:hypothetical protein
MYAFFDRIWGAMPEEMKVRIRAGIKARAEGLSPLQALAAADAEVARDRELMARYEALSAAAPPGPVAQAAKATADANNPAMPRGWSL